MRTKTKAQRMFFNSVCFFGSALLGVLVTANQSLYYEISMGLGLPAQRWIGILHACMFGGMLLSCLVVGELCERLNKKWVFVGASGVTAAGAVLLWSATSTPACIVGYLLLGCGFGVIDGQTNGLLADENPDRSAHMFSFNGAFFSFGAVLSPLVVNRYLAAGGSWNHVYMAAAALFALLAVMFTTLQFTVKPKAQNKQIISFRLIRTPLFLLAGVFMLIYSGAEAGASSWTTNYFTTHYSNSLFAGVALSVFWASTGVGRVLGGALSHHRALVFWVSAGLGAAGLIGMLLANDPIVAMACYALSGIGFGPLWPLGFALGVDASGGSTGASSSMLMLFTSLGGTLLPLLLGLLENNGVFIASICLLGLVMVLYYAYTAVAKRKNTGIGSSRNG